MERALAASAAAEVGCELFSSTAQPPADCVPAWLPQDANHARIVSALQDDLSSLEGRDTHLWSIALLIALVLSAGICALLLPGMIWHAGELRIDSPYLPQVFFGFI